MTIIKMVGMKWALTYFIILATGCTNSFHLPSLDLAWSPKIGENERDIQHAESILLGIDPDGGCKCRGLLTKWAICYGGNKCVTFPRNLMIDVKLFRLKMTNIKRLKNEDFLQLSHIESMEIEVNHNLTDIEPGTFINLTNLSNLSISYNTNLKHLEEGVFDGLESLNELRMVKNGFRSISDFSISLSPIYLPNLLKLSVNENFFREVTENDFRPLEGSPLEELNLILCQIEYIHPKSFQPLQDLKGLRLGENINILNESVLTDVINQIVEDEIPLLLLNLYGMGFHKRPPKSLLEAIARSNVTHLILARNQFEFLAPEMFPKMPNLEFLDLRDVLALTVEPAALQEDTMPNLKTLLFSGNKLTGISEGVLLNHLEVLDISGNSGDAFHPSDFDLGSKAFKNMTKLTTLNLSFNRIISINNTTFVGLSNLKTLGLKNASIFHLEQGAFSSLNELLFLNLENNPYRTFNNLTKDSFEGLYNLQVLLLGGCAITNLSANPFLNLIHLKHLDLKNNLLLTVSSDVFSSLNNLIRLDLSENELSPWKNHVFKNNTNLEYLSMTGNKITYISTNMMEDFQQLSYLDLKRNPFHCDCYAFSSLNKWLNVNNVSSITIFINSGAKCFSPDGWQEKPLSKYIESISDHKMDCQNPNSLSKNKILVLLPLAILVILIIVSVVIAYFYRWHIRYWIFLARIAIGKRNRSRSNCAKSYSNYQYDAFVSYSNEDRNFVVRLVAMLENFEPFFKLCVYERDFQIGTVISESVLESVAMSRKTILIISDAFAKSQWCRWETQLAENHRLFMDDTDVDEDSLIMIRLGAVCGNHMTPTLKYLLKTRIYLQWDPEPKKQKIFWDKLRNTLLKKGNEVTRF